METFHAGRAKRARSRLLRPGDYITIEFMGGVSSIARIEKRGLFRRAVLVSNTSCVMSMRELNSYDWKLYIKGS